MEDLFIYVAKATGILFLFWLTYTLFLKRETYFTTNRWFLLLGLVAAATLPLLSFTKTVWVAPSITAPVFETIPIPTTGELDIPKWGWEQLLWICYGLGTTYFTLRLLFQLASIESLKRTGTIRRAKDLIHVETKQEVAPFSFFRYIFFYPKQFNKQELHTILEHEKVHAQQLHSIDTLVLELLMLILWWNPLLWLYRNSVKQNHEFLADANSYISSEEKKFYQYLLLKQVTGQKQFAIAHPFYNSSIKKRIIMLNQNQSKRSSVLKLVVILPALCLFLYAFNTKTVYQTKRTSSATSKISNATKISIEIDKNTSDESLKKNSKFFSSNGIQVDFKGIKRNSDGELTAIKVVYDNGAGDSGNYVQKKNIGISPFVITVDLPEDSAPIIEISAVTDQPTATAYSHENIWISKPNTNAKVFQFKTTDSISHIFSNGNSISIDSLHNSIGLAEKTLLKVKGVIDSLSVGGSTKIHRLSIRTDDDGILEEASLLESALDSAKAFIIITNKNEEISNLTNGQSIFIAEHVTDSTASKTIDILGENNKLPLYVVDGKVTDATVAQNIDSHTIATINILKGDAAVKKHGEKAKNGVVVIVTKKN